MTKLGIRVHTTGINGKLDIPITLHINLHKFDAIVI
jgi:hypothetical protein